MSRAFTVAGWLVEPDLNSISGNGANVRVEPKVMEVLVCLARQPGEVVGKEKLIAEVWPDTFVTDDVLTRAISELRKAFGDDAKDARIIQTIPKRGYRLAEAVQAAATSVPAARPRSFQRALAGGTLALALIATALFTLATRDTLLTEADLIVVAEFDNRTGDEVFDGTLQQALIIKLEESPFLNVASAQQIAHTLRLMERSPSERLLPVLAREVCVRQGATAVIGGAIAALGSNYVVTLTATNCHTGDSLAREQVEAAGKGKVLDELGRSAMHLRRNLGESLASTRRFNAPLEEATTSSLEALKAYTLSLSLNPNIRHEQSVALLQHALELDPSFAVAHVRLSYAYWDGGRFDDASRHAELAFGLRDRATERERLMITENYYALVQFDYRKAAENGEVWRTMYPRDSTAYNVLSVVYAGLGQHERALNVSEEALRLPRSSAAPYVNLGSAYLRLGRLKEAKATLQAGLEYAPRLPVLRQLLWRVALLEDDDAAMQEHAAAMSSDPADVLALEWPAALVAGRIETARKMRARAIELARSQGKEDVAAGLLAQGALGEAFLDPPAGVRTSADAAFVASSYPPIQVNATLALALAGESRRALRIAEELGERLPHYTVMHGRDKPILSAVAHLQRRDTDRALETLRLAKPFDMTMGMHVVYLRGLAYLQSGALAEAAGEFRRVLDNPGLSRFSPTYPLSQLGLARAYAAMGDAAQSRKAYEDLLMLWQRADPDLPLLLQARAEYEALAVATGN